MKDKHIYILALVSFVLFIIAGSYIFTLFSSIQANMTSSLENSGLKTYDDEWISFNYDEEKFHIIPNDAYYNNWVKVVNMRGPLGYEDIVIYRTSDVGNVNNYANKFYEEEDGATGGVCNDFNGINSIDGTPIFVVKRSGDIVTSSDQGNGYTKVVTNRGEFYTTFIFIKKSQYVYIIYIKRDEGSKPNEKSSQIMNELLSSIKIKK